MNPYQLKNDQGEHDICLKEYDRKQRQVEGLMRKLGEDLQLHRTTFTEDVGVFPSWGKVKELISVREGLLELLTEFHQGVSHERARLESEGS